MLNPPLVQIGELDRAELATHRPGREPLDLLLRGAQPASAPLTQLLGVVLLHDLRERHGPARGELMPPLDDRRPPLVQHHLRPPFRRPELACEVRPAPDGLDELTDPALARRGVRDVDGGAVLTLYGVDAFHREPHTSTVPSSGK